MNVLSSLEHLRLGFQLFRLSTYPDLRLLISTTYPTIFDMSCLASNLCQLPPELFENVLEYVGDAEIGWLRLTCKNLRDRTHHRFRSRFTCRQTDLSAISLQRLIDISSHDQFGPAVKTVTIVAVLYDTAYLHGLMDCETPSPLETSYNPTETPDRPRVGYGTREISGIKELTESEVAQVKWEQSLLSQHEAEQHGPKVREVRTGYGDGHRPVGRTDVAEEEEKTRLCRTMLTITFCQLGRLQSLILEAAVYKVAAVRLAAFKCTDPQVMWNKASYVFHVVMTAMAESQMTVDHLGIYGGSWGCSVCSVMIEEVLNCWREQAREKALAAVKSLALCVSVYRLCGQIDFSATRNAVSKVHRFSSIARFLALCPNVEELEIHGYLIGAERSRFQPVFEAVTKEVRFASLLTCTLKGLELREIDLIQFLQINSKLANLKLRNVTLKQGSWHNFFRCCSNRVVGLEMLSIQRLYIFRNERLIFENEDGNGAVSISGEELKRGINFRTTVDRGYSEIRRREREEYGPPHVVPDRLQFDGIGRGS